MERFENQVQAELEKTIGKGNWRHPNYLDHAINIGQLKDNMIQNSYTINRFLKIVSTLARTSILNNDKVILKLLFSESPAGLDISYHAELPKCCWNIPLFYRTDQSVSGKIFEIQAPGSGWGDLSLLSKLYCINGDLISKDYLHFPQKYSNIINKATGKSRSGVFHMIDAASVPNSMRYLMFVTSQYLDYWGLSSDIKMDTVDCLISHSVISQTTSNYFLLYLEKAKNNEFVFGISPNIIFDEKAIYLLPFNRYTCHYFDNEIRELFPFTTYIENDGFYSEDNSFVSINEFISRKPSERRYFLKYGGPDTNRNWGSRSVFRLDNKDCNELLRMASELSKHGEIWLIQKDVGHDDNADDSYTDDINELLNEKLHIKISGFYGSNVYLGSKVMARKHFKVHGQEDTIVSLGV